MISSVYSPPSTTVSVMSNLQTAAERREFMITAEVSPPKGGDPTPFLHHVQALKGRVHAVNVTDSNRAMARMSPLAASVLLLQTGVEPVFQLACRDRNRLALQGDLMGAEALGIKNVLALTGDPLKAGDCKDARSVFEYESVRLLALVQKLNQGLDCNDKPLPDQGTTLYVGAAVDPQCPSFSGLQRRFQRKLDQGAQFFQTQLITDFDLMAQFMEKLGYTSGKPILAGIFLLKSAKSARFINKYLPGVQIPDTIIQRLAEAQDPLEEGIQIAAEQVRRAQQICQGVHLMAIKKEDRIPDILDLAGLSAVQIP